jgi:hypothetical protein
VEETSVLYAVPPGAVREIPPPIAIARWSSWPRFLYKVEKGRVSVQAHYRSLLACASATAFVK